MPALTKLLVALRFYATGKFQQCTAISQSTICRIIDEVTNALSEPEVIKRFIGFPVSLEEVRLNQREFYALSQFPCVVGVIDGTTYKQSSICK